MSSGEFHLWGIDGELQGNEHRLQIRLPMFTRTGEHGVVYMARHLDWSPELGHSDVVRIPSERAAEYGEPLSIPPTPIMPGQFAVVIGPELRRNLAILGVPLPKDAVDSLDFGVVVRDVAAADRLARHLEVRARRDFDREIASGTVTKKARAALSVMRNVGTGDLRAHLLRTLVMHFLNADTDQYRRVLRLGATRLRDDAEVIEREVRQHLDLSRRMTRRAGHLPMAAMKSLSARGHATRRRSTAEPRRQHE